MKKIRKGTPEYRFITFLMGGNARYFLTALSSVYSEGDEKQFKEEYGFSFAEAEEIVRSFLLSR
jgi:hypothetical protein